MVTQGVMDSMFRMELPLVEKIARPVIVYLVLVVFLRLFGKRELAQLNPFDLVVLLCLSNTVQNAIIGNDNSVSGGVVGVFALLTVNWGLTRVLFRMPRVNASLQGEETVLIRHGVVDRDAMKREALTELELKTVIHKQGLARFGEVERCVLEPSGNFYVEEMDPLRADSSRAAILKQLEALNAEMKELRGMLAARG